MGLHDEAETLTNRTLGKRTEKQFPPLPDREFLKRRLENEINALYERLAKSLKEENERLREENRKWKEEVERLR
jgi:predicted nuclease with TOPRIM domain